MIENHFCFQLPKEGCHSIARAIARELFPRLVNWKLFFFIVCGESCDHSWGIALSNLPQSG